MDETYLIGGEENALMRQSQEVKYKVKEMLMSLPTHYTDGAEKHVVVRCPYCGDSVDPKKAHFSVLVDLNDEDSPMLYNCWKCPASGIIGPTELEDLGFHLDSDFYQTIKEVSRRSKKYNHFTNNYVEKYDIPIYQVNDTGLSKRKLEYVNERLGTSFDPLDAQKLKMILNFGDFIKLNKIKSLKTVSSKLAMLLHYQYIGFLSNNNNTIVFRYIGNDEKRNRYIKVILNPNNTNPASFYSIPNSLDLLYTDNIDIHIAEGVMDILSVYANLCQESLNKKYYFAACGFSFLNIIKYCVYSGLNTGINVHIWCDNDKSDVEELALLRKIDDNIGTWLDRIYFHRNQFPNEKDFGVPLARIIDGTNRIR